MEVIVITIITLINGTEVTGGIEVNIFQGCAPIMLMESISTVPDICHPPK